MPTRRHFIVTDGERHGRHGPGPDRRARRDRRPKALRLSRPCNRGGQVVVADAGSDGDVHPTARFRRPGTHGRKPVGQPRAHHRAGPYPGHGRGRHRRRGPQHQPVLVRGRPRRGGPPDPGAERGSRRDLRDLPGPLRGARHGGAAAPGAGGRAARGGRHGPRVGGSVGAASAARSWPPAASIRSGPRPRSWTRPFSCTRRASPSSHRACRETASSAT